MKRATNTRDESATEKSSKQLRTKSRSSPAATDRFAKESEVQASALPDTTLNEAGHIIGQIFMLWNISKNTRKLQLSTESGALDVVFEGLGIEKLDFATKDRIKIALKGGRTEVKKAGSPHTLPFKLVFPDGAIVQFLASEKREEAKLVDLFKDAEEEDRKVESDWYYPPPEVDPSSERHEIDQTSLPPSSGSYTPVLNTHELQGHSTRVSNLDSHPPKDVEFNARDDQITHGLDDSESQVNYNYIVGASHTEIVPPAPPNTSHSFDPDQTIDSSASLAVPISGSPPPPPPPTAKPPRKMEKRVKKRDTRHPRGSTGSATSDPVSVDVQNSPNKNVQKPLGKKARQRLAQRKKAEEAQAKAQPPPTLPPLLDPALELVPGFHSDKGGLYTPVGDVAPGKSYSLVGVVADVGGIKTTKTGDRCKSFVLADPSQYAFRGLTVNIFVSESDEELLPSAKLGQVLLLRNVKVKDFNGKLQGTCYKDSFQWCGYNPTEGKHFYSITGSQPSINIIPSSSQSGHNAFFKPSATELEYFVKLADWWRALKEAAKKERGGMDGSFDGNITTHILVPRLGERRKLQTISEMEHETFVDCVVEVLKVWRNDLNSAIYVTDYSENRYLEHNFTPDNGLLGRRSLKITLWDGPNAMAEVLEVHNLYLLENLRLKRKGTTRHLEGSMGYQERGIRKIGQGSNQANVEELLMRKKAYNDNPQFSIIESDGGDDIPEPMQQGHAVTKNHQDLVSKSPDLVKCFYTNQQCSTIEEVRQNKMCPNKFRVRARIIEYYPRHVKDFVTVQCKGCEKILDEGYRLCPGCGDLSENSTTVRYQFALRVIDESEGELNVCVNNEEADEFLAGLDAKDARDDIALLRARLMPILGHLDKWHEDFDEETKVEAGPWLDLCVSSWFPEIADGGETLRLYKLFGCQLCAGEI